MASGQTQYYGLSQWEAVDKVERVDFNSDNARVDGALRALAEQVALDGAVSQLREENRMVFLGRTALNTAASSFDLPVPDWTGYWELQLHYDLQGSGEIKLSFNDGEAYYVSA